MFLVLLIALLGMQTLGGIYTPAAGYSAEPCPGGQCPTRRSRSCPTTTSTTLPAMMTTFCVFTGVVGRHLHANAVLGAEVLAYFVPTVLIGRYLILNLFVGILLQASPRKPRRPRARRRCRPRPRCAAPPPHPRRSHRRPRQPPPLRRFCKWLIEQLAFETLIVLVILASAVCMTLDSPRLPPNRSSTCSSATLTTCGCWLEMAARWCPRLLPPAPTWRPVERARLRDRHHLLPRARRSPRCACACCAPGRSAWCSASAACASSSPRSSRRCQGGRGLAVVLAITVFAILGMQSYMGMLGCTDPTITTRDLCVEPESGAPSAACQTAAR